MKRPAITQAMRWAVLKEYGASVLCTECGDMTLLEEVQIDHHLALVDGGAHDVANIRPLCPRCHKVKSAREHVANCKAKRLLKKHSSPTPEGSIKSRGFQGSRKFNGKVTWRTK